MHQPNPAPTRLLDGMPYKHSSGGVDVRDTWRKYGWQPTPAPKPTTPNPPERS